MAIAAVAYHQQVSRFCQQANFDSLFKYSFEKVENCADKKLQMFKNVLLF